MSKRPVYCAWCNEKVYLDAGAINRARLGGYYLYCSRVCSGFGRRKGKTIEQKRAEKAAYDAEYRANNRQMLKAKKAAYFQRTYDPVEAAKERKANMPRHVEYCRRPEYKVKKRDYDKSYRATREFGEFAEASMLLSDIEREVAERASKYEIGLQNGTINKAMNRRREYDKSFSS